MKQVEKSLQHEQEFLIGLDLGTSMLKGVLINTEGKICSTAREPMAYDTQENGCIEFDAVKFYDKISGITRRLSAELPGYARIMGVSMASASGNTLLVDHAGNPVIPAISWMDNRAGDEIHKVFGDLDQERIYSEVGWPYEGGLPLVHLAWLRVHRPELLENAAYVCMSTEYINFRLTGKWGIDPSTATPFYLQKQCTSCWNAHCLERLGIAEHKLPTIQGSGTVLGNVTEKAAKETGLPAGTPVVLGSFDHPSAARGSGVLEEGQMLLSCGTSWVGFFPVSDRKKIVSWGMLTDPFLQPGGPWAGMYALPAVSENIDKLICRYIADGPDRYDELDKLAAAAPDGAGGLFIDPLATAPISFGDDYEKKMIARAMMEGAALRVKAWLHAMDKRGIHISGAVMVGGPSESKTWPRIVCDVLQIPITTLNGSFAGAIGAAMMAGIGAGIFIDERDAFDKMNFCQTNWVPDGKSAGFYKDLYEKYIGG